MARSSVAATATVSAFPSEIFIAFEIPFSEIALLADGELGGLAIALRSVVHHGDDDLVGPGRPAGVGRRKVVRRVAVGIEIVGFVELRDGRIRLLSLDVFGNEL